MAAGNRSGQSYLVARLRLFCQDLPSTWYNFLYDIVSGISNFADEIKIYIHLLLLFIHDCSKQPSFPHVCLKKTGSRRTCFQNC